jgi:hypothetical protein
MLSDLVSLLLWKTFLSALLPNGFFLNGILRSLFAVVASGSSGFRRVFINRLKIVDSEALFAENRQS